MGRLFHIPGIFFLFSAFVLLLLVSISLPYLTALDFARVHFDEGKVTAGNDTNALTQLRVRDTTSDLSLAYLTTARASLVLGTHYRYV